MLCVAPDLDDGLIKREGRSFTLSFQQGAAVRAIKALRHQLNTPRYTSAVLLAVLPSTEKLSSTSVRLYNTSEPLSDRFTISLRNTILLKW